jgi:hypothetical protein
VSASVVSRDISISGVHDGRTASRHCCRMPSPSDNPWERLPLPLNLSILDLTFAICGSLLGKLRPLCSRARENIRGPCKTNGRTPSSQIPTGEAVIGFVVADDWSISLCGRRALQGGGRPARGPALFRLLPAG